MALLNVRGFRIFSFVEAISFLLLLFVAMPLKYAFGLPLAVTIVGTLHGVIFLMYLALVAGLAFRVRWGFFTILGSLVAAVLPFGPFLFDRWVLSRRPA